MDCIKIRKNCRDSNILFSELCDNKFAYLLEFFKVSCSTARSGDPFIDGYNCIAFGKNIDVLINAANYTCNTIYRCNKILNFSKVDDSMICVLDLDNSTIINDTTERYSCSYLYAFIISPLSKESIVFPDWQISDCPGTYYGFYEESFVDDIAFAQAGCTNYGCVSPCDSDDYNCDYIIEESTWNDRDAMKKCRKFVNTLIKAIGGVI